MNDLTCFVDECERTAHSKLMCKMHYERNRKTGSPHKPIKAPSPTICRTDGCEKPRYQAHWYCGSHFMKLRRHGDAMYQHVTPFADLTGQRFGLLLVASRTDGKWLCHCDCGQSSVVAVGDLNRGSITSCGDKKHTRVDNVEYGAAHCRLKTDLGRARIHSCVECGRNAAHWSYNHDDPDEMTSKMPLTLGVAYSLKSEHYSPRCVSCHKLYDLHRLDSALDQT